jgi:hypothetical protein
VASNLFTLSETLESAVGSYLLGEQRRLLPKIAEVVVVTLLRVFVYSIW